MNAPESAALRAIKAARPLSGEVFGAMINLSGRRRFTSQRIVLYALLAAQGQEGSLAVAQEALALFRSAHQALLSETDELPGVFCAELQQAYFGKYEGDRKIRGFADLAERALRAIEGGTASALTLQTELVQATTPTLVVLNQITGIYEEQSRLHARQMRRQLRSVISEIETINRQARMVAFNARIVAARAGHAGTEFSVVAGVMSNISGEIDQMISTALAAAA